MADAGRRYQRTFKGAVKHGERNARYRAHILEKVTHQGSLFAPGHAMLDLGSGEGAEGPSNLRLEFDVDGRTRCSGCAAFCGPFARTKFAGRVPVRNRGGKNERFEGNRIRDS